MTSMRVTGLVVGAILVACGASGGGGGTAAAPTAGVSSGSASTADSPRGSCLVANLACEEYFGPVSAEALAARRARCGETSGTWADGACASHGSIGGCRTPAPQETARAAGTSMVAWLFTLPGGMTAAAMRDGCTHEGGQFVDAPH